MNGLPSYRRPSIKGDFLPSQMKAVMNLVGQKTLLGGLGWTPLTLDMEIGHLWRKVEIIARK